MLTQVSSDVIIHCLLVSERNILGSVQSRFAIYIIVHMYVFFFPLPKKVERKFEIAARTLCLHVILENASEL